MCASLQRKKRNKIARAHTCFNCCASSRPMICNLNGIFLFLSPICWLLVADAAAALQNFLFNCILNLLSATNHTNTAHSHTLARARAQVDSIRTNRANDQRSKEMELIWKYWFDFILLCRSLFFPIDCIKKPPKFSGECLNRWVLCITLIIVTCCESAWGSGSLFSDNRIVYCCSKCR